MGLRVINEDIVIGFGDGLKEGGKGRQGVKIHLTFLIQTVD